jgi:DNA-binding NtrC family response regulator
MIGTSQAVSNVLKIVQKVINHNLPVLITGETGTGKELVSRILHYSGHRKKGPFVAVNCAGFSKDLLESELFGHEKGSFTGAIQLKKGVFEQATDGTLLLDEIGEMPFEMQSKLLRVLQGGEYRRIGGTSTLSTNARIVLATNRNLDELVIQKTFREDLLYRIKVVEIHLPSLRDRVEDIPLLAISFLKEAMVACDKKFLGFTTEAMEILRAYSWPGNIRQLKSVIERAAALSDDDWIDVTDLDEQIVQAVGTSQVPETSGSLAEIEKSHILSRLEKYNWNVASAAKSLGITRHGLYSKMKRYHVSSPKKS